MSKSGIYKIEHVTSGRVYVGSSVNIASRRRHHLGNLRRGSHFNVKLQNAWNKYGEQAFAFILIEECERGSLALRE